MDKYKRIIFLGFRCSGKTTLSKALSEKIKMQCFDIDEEIEKEENKSITQITKNGNDWYNFRYMETQKLQKLLTINNIIISGGGGIGTNNIIFNKNLTFGEVQKKMIINNKETLKILLYASPSIIKERLYKDQKTKNNRPNLTNNNINMEDYLDANIKIMIEREKNYREMANITFDTGNKNIDMNIKNLFNIIIQKYRNFSFTNN